MKHTLALLLVLGLAPLLPAAEPAGLRAGAAAVDITPQEFPLNMPGGFSANIAESAHDPLHARALVLDDGATTLAMVVVDNLGAGPDVLDEAKEIASREDGHPDGTDADLLDAHAHGAAAAIRARSPAGGAYRKLFWSRVWPSRSSRRMRRCGPPPSERRRIRCPTRSSIAAGILKPGKMPLNPFGKLDTVKMNPGTSPDVLDHPAGPTDPDITIISVQDAKRKPLALFANYSLHYVGGMPPGADLGGLLRRVRPRVMPSRLRGARASSP